MRTVEEIRTEMKKVSRAKRAAAQKHEHCVQRLAELNEELQEAEKGGGTDGGENQGTAL